MSEPTLYTIGYGNRQPADFFALIPDGAHVIDVRYYPECARLPQYRDRPLRLRYHERWQREQGRQERFSYETCRALGNVSGRPDVWTPPDDACITTEIALRRLVEALYFGDADHPVVLMCAERDASRCHRRFVAQAIAERVPGLVVVDL